MKHPGSAPKGAASWLPHSTPVRLPQRGREGLGDPSHPLAHVAHMEALCGRGMMLKVRLLSAPKPVRPACPPHPHTFPFSGAGAGGHWGSCPHHNLVPGLGCDGSFSVSGPQAGPGSFLIPFLSPSKPSPWPSEKRMSSVLNCPILPLPVPLQPKGGSGRLPPFSNPHFT